MDRSISQKSLSILSVRLLTQLENIKSNRFEWVLAARENLLKGWKESRREYTEWLHQVEHEIQQLKDMGEETGAEWLAHTLLRDPAAFDSSEFKFIIPTGHGVEVIFFKGFADGAYTIVPTAAGATSPDGVSGTGAGDGLHVHDPAEDSTSTSDTCVQVDPAQPEIAAAATPASENETRERADDPSGAANQCSQSAGDARPATPKHTGEASVMDKSLAKANFAIKIERPDQNPVGRKNKRNKAHASVTPAEEDNDVVSNKKACVASGAEGGADSTTVLDSQACREQNQPPKSVYDKLKLKELRDALTCRGIPVHQNTNRRWLVWKLLHHDEEKGCLAEALVGDSDRPKSDKPQMAKSGECKGS